jgi:two-component system cell cycle sensor histidine kinase/response regulator CckA
MNPAALAVSGVTETDIIGKTHLECGFSEDLSHLWEEKITQVFETGKPSQTEFSWEGVNGMVHLDWRLTPEFDADNRVMSVLGVSRDITDRKLAEKELRELEERFRLTFYTSPDAVNINKMDGTYFEINEGFTQLTGFTREDVIGKTSADISIWDIPEDRERLVEGLRRDGFVKNLESRFLMKDGSCKIALMSAVIIQLKGEPHILSITRDITSFKKAEEDKLILERQLQQAQKMESVGRLAGGVAHDFNNMLGVILGHAELAMEELDPSQRIFADLQQIKQAANRSTDITRQLLTFARKQIVTPKVIDLNETVAGMLKMLLRLIGEDIDLAWLPGKGLWPIKIDPAQIDQILANLCVNARDAIAGVGKITVGTDNCTLEDEYCSAHAGFAPGQYVRIEVSDNGSGMDKETLPNIFEPFFTTKGVNEGTGLGLATIYGIVKQNNGFINVYSELEQGTTFTIYLPRHVGTENQRQLEAPAEPTLRGNETLLLVEDEPTILNMTTTMLERLGYKVLGAGTPIEAIRLADDHSVEIHLLLTDVIMPEMNGRLLAEKLLADRPEMKCLFMSGYTANVISHHGVLEEGVHFIQKPFARRELAAKIRQALGNG